jgi:hypothetical protein
VEACSGAHEYDNIRRGTAGLIRAISDDNANDTIANNNACRLKFNRTHGKFQLANQVWTKERKSARLVVVMMLDARGSIATCAALQTITRRTVLNRHARMCQGCVIYVVNFNAASNIHSKAVLDIRHMPTL